MKKDEKKLPPVIAVSGIKNSGKTTFIENILPLLEERGIKTAVIKHDGHSFEADVEGTDTYRLRKAGAAGIAVYCDTHYMIINQQRTEPEYLMQQFADADLIICEGLKESAYKKIEIVRADNSNECVCEKEHLLAVVTDCEKEFERPVIGLNDYEGAAVLILEYLREEK